MSTGVLELLQADQALSEAHQSYECSLSETELREMIEHVLNLHRHKDAFITFARPSKAGQLFHDDSVRADHLSSVFPEFVRYYLEDAYVGMNAAGAPRTFWPHDAESAPAHLKAISWRTKKSLHCASNLLRLNACFVDVDCNRNGFDRTPEDVLKELGRLVTAGTLPKPTTIIYSGGGVWMLWHLHDVNDPTMSHLGCQPEVIFKYREINRQIGHHFEHLGADSRAIDAARLTALHGTRKSKYAGKKVVWSPYPGGRSYTLVELVKLVGYTDHRGEPVNAALKDVGQPKALRVRPFGPRTEKSEWCARGHKRSKNNRLAYFESVRTQRGKFVEGFRDNAAFVLSRCFENKGIPQDEALKLVRRFGETGCSPPLDRQKCEEKVRSAYLTPVYLSYQGMADFLGVTVEEACQASTDVGTSFPPQSGAGAQIPAPKMADIEKRRRENILAIHRTRGNILSFAKLLVLLAEMGTPTCKGTLSKDFKEMKIKTPRMRSKLQNTTKTLAEQSMKLAGNW